MSIKNRPSKESVAFLKEVLKENNFDLQQEISLCLSDLPKSHMTKGNNGKLYMNLTIGIRKEPDQWGRDLKVYVSPTSEDRSNHLPKTYVGGGKMIIFVQQSGEIPTQSDVDAVIPPAEADEKSNLPY